MQVGVPRHEELLLKFRFTEALDAALTTQRQEVSRSRGGAAAADSRGVDRRIDSRLLAGCLRDHANDRLYPPCPSAQALRHFKPNSVPCPLPPACQVVERVVEAVVLHGALEATLAAAPAELVASLLRHVSRQLSSPRHARGALAVADCLLSSDSPALASGGPARERLAQLRAAVTEELRTQEQLLVLQGVVGALVQAA